MIDRRTFMAGVTALPVGMRTAWAQTPRQSRTIGILYSYAEEDAEALRFHSAFRRRLETLGWTEGRNVEFVIRWTRGDPGRILALAEEIAGLKPDAILTHGTQLIAALGRETRSIPIIFAGASDPVESGLVASLARPGGNITGFSTVQFANNGKLLELLKEVAPQLSRVAVVQNSDNPSQPGRFEGIATAGRTLGVDVIPIDLKIEADIDRGIDSFATTPGGGLIILPGAFAGTHRARIIAAAARGGLPAMYPRDFYVHAGGLMSYSVNQVDLFSQAALYVSRVLNGDKPADLPVQTPTSFYLALNMKTARELALDVPVSILSRVDELIE